MSLRKHLILPSIVFALALLAGCNTSNTVTTNNNGYSNTDFSGTYVFSFSGTDVNLTAQTQSFFAIAGTITADGKGHIQSGTVDINDANIGGVFTAQALTASTYSVSQDGRGTGTLVTPQGTFGLDFVMTSDSGGLISRFDSNGSGSGTFALQGTATQGSLSGLAFTLFGTDASFNFLGSVGAFTLNGSGVIQSGLEDFNDAGAGTDTQTLTGSLVLSSNTAGTAAFDTSFAPGLTFDVWVVDSTHLKLIETDTTGPALVGDAFPQASTFPAGQLVFSMAGGSLSSGNPIATGGFVTTDANGNLSNGTEDYNNAGTTGTISDPPFSGSCNATAPFAGDRCELTTSVFTNGNQGNLVFAAYPSTAGVLLLEDDGSGFLQGAAYAQSATAFGAPEGYALNLSGFNSNGVADSEVDDIAQFNATSTNLTGVLDENDVASALITANLNGTYTAPASGRGTISATTNGTYVGGLSLGYYVIGSSATLVIEGDQQQVTTGVFELQSSPGSSVSKAVKPQEAQTAAAAQSIVSLVRPFGRAKLTPKHFTK